MSDETAAAVVEQGDEVLPAELADDSVLVTEDPSMPALFEAAFDRCEPVTLRLGPTEDRPGLWTGRSEATLVAHWDDHDGWIVDGRDIPRRGVLGDLPPQAAPSIAYTLLGLGWQVEATSDCSRRSVIARPRSVRTGDLAARSWKYFALPTGAALKFEWVRPTDGADWELGTSGRLGAEITEPFHPEDVFILGLELAPDWVMPDEANGAPTKHSDGEDVAASMLPASAFHPVPEPDADELARRKASLARWLADEGFDGPFPDRDAVRSHLSADGPSAAGHYLLSFSDGQAYIGETIDFVGRFAQHSVTYSDIEAFYIRSDAAAQTLISRNRDSAKRSLRRDERALIHAAQNDGLILRNTMEMANPIKVSRTFSELVSADEIDRWVAQPLSANADDSAVAQRVERQHTAARGQAFNAFINLSEAEQVLRIVRAYLERCVPFPARTEYASWAISCMPKSLRGARGEKERWSVLCCLSIARPETLTITRNKQTGHVSGFVAANEVELGCDEDLGVVRLIRQHPGIRINYEAHASFGPGVVLLHAPDLDALEDLLDDTRVTRAASTVALRMCRVGPSTQRAVHNPYLVERAMGWERE